MRGQNAARAAAYKDNLVMDILQKRTWAQIDLDAAAHNFKEIRRDVGDRSMVCCVIKADASGHLPYLFYGYKPFSIHVPG